MADALRLSGAPLWLYPLTWDRVAPALLLISAKIVTDEHSTELALRRL